MDAIHIDLTDRIPPFLLKAATYIENKLNESGYEIYLVGGSVRDLLLNREISDLDFTTNALPENMMKIFPRTIPVGEKFGTILVMFHHLPIEITTYRNEGKYLDGRRPETVIFGDSLYEDVIRRDFTINGMAYQISQKLLVDYVGGRADIDKKLVKTIGNPLERFREDGLRPLRGCRIMANLGFSLDPDTEKAMGASLDIVSKVAPERFYDEWKKTLRLKDKHIYWNKIKDTGIFNIFFPEFTGLLYEKDRWENLLTAIEHSMPRHMSVYCAHIFYHETSSRIMTALPNQEVLKNLMNRFFLRNRFPIKYQKLCASLLTSPFFETLDHPDKGDKEIKIRKALSKLDPKEWFWHLRFIREVLYVNQYFYANKALINQFISLVAQTIRNYNRRKFSLYIKELCIDGNDLKKLGFSGVEIGVKLQQSLQYVIENPDQNNPASLEKFLNKGISKN
jgi:tRNA nucleotidyltransferase/poly(A) polymerase